MPTKIVLVISGPSGEGDPGLGQEFVLAEGFQTVLNKLYPVQPASSALEHQTNMQHTLLDGRKVAISPHHIGYIEEVEE